MTCRVLIVDDERLARAELRDLLRPHRAFEVVGEAQDAAAAHQLVVDEKPDLVFLDVEMPGANAFDFLLESRHRFAVIFVTAYDQYAIKAFDVDAVDYLVKPVSPVRLERALDRFVSRGDEQAGNQRLARDDYVFLKKQDGACFLLVRSIRLVRADGDYTIVETDKDETHRFLRSLTQWEQKLPSAGFLRIHRSTIVNLEHVQRVESWFNHNYRVWLRGVARPVSMSRRYAARIKDRL